MGKEKVVHKMNFKIKLIYFFNFTYFVIRSVIGHVLKRGIVQEGGWKEVETYWQELTAMHVYSPGLHLYCRAEIVILVLSFPPVNINCRLGSDPWICGFKPSMYNQFS